MLDRFWSKVDKSPGHGPNGDCWIWTASKKSGNYGSFRIGGKREYAHRYAYSETHNSVLTSNDEICHTCDYELCVNPKHLFKSTHLGNMEDRANKDRQPKGEDHYSVKLTEKLVIEAFQAWNNGKPISELARSLGVTYSTMYDAIKGRNWKHLNLTITQD